MTPEARETLPPARRFRDCALVVPAEIDSTNQAAIGYPELPTCFGQCESFAVDRYHSVSACVVVLSQLQCPVAVVGRIWSVVVAAFNAVPRWARSHVGVERSEVILPAVAHCDTAPAICSKIWNVRIKTPLFSARPNVVLRTVFTETMHKMASVPEAAATLLVLFSRKDVAANNGFFSAVATTQPCRIFSDVGGSTEHSQFAETTAG